MNSISLIIGIDGGASKVSAHIVNVSDDSNFMLGKYSSVKEYKNYAEFQNDFKPVDLQKQLKQMQNNAVDLTKSEIIQAKAYYFAFVDCISEIVQQKPSNKLIIGIGMPGIKTADKRGIIAMANGPRMPNFVKEIEQRLSAAGIALAKPIAKLGSDADNCGIGEEFAENGTFRDVQNAYYLGGGTGAADAIKLHGKLLSFDSCKMWIAKTWEMKNASEKSMEIFCSANGIQSLFSGLIKIPQEKLTTYGIFLEQILKRAQNNDEIAVLTCQIVSNNLAQLLFERIVTLYSGWQNTFSFTDPKRALPNPDHDYKYTLFDRIIIGQRLGMAMKNSSGNKYLLQPILNKLTELIINECSIDERARSHYIIDKKFNENLIVISNLREAPVLGAGINAYRNSKF